MSDEYSADLITLIDGDGEEHEFEILDEIGKRGRRFYALLPTFNSPEESLEADTYYIFEVIEEDGEEQLAEVEDEDLS